MAIELSRAQSSCTTPALDFYPPDVTSERTDVSTDDHGWWKYSGTTTFPLGGGDFAEMASSTAFSWGLGYYFTNGQPSDGQYEEVIIQLILITVTPLVLRNIVARLYNVSGVYKFRIWNKETDSQIGSDSAAVTVGQVMLVNLKIDDSAETVELFLDGSSIISATALPTFLVLSGGLVAGAASTGTARYWSAWCNYFSASDNLNEAHFPELRLLHPDGEGNYGGQYLDFSQNPATFDEWDDLASEGDPDGGTTGNGAPDAANQIETSTLTTHTMTNTIQGVVELLSLRSDQATKTVVHGAIIRVGSTDFVGSFGSEDIGTSYVVREAVFYTEPSTGTWTQALINGMEAGHRRDVASLPLNLEVTAIAVVVVALGATDLAPPDPPGVVSVGRRRVHLQLF